MAWPFPQQEQHLLFSYLWVIPREEVAYVTCTYRETCVDQPDFLATVDLNPRSPCYGQLANKEQCPVQGALLSSVSLLRQCCCSQTEAPKAQVIHRLPMPNHKDELHSSGWSTGCTCFDNASTQRTKLILPSFISSRIYVVDVGSQCRAPRLWKRAGSRFPLSSVLSRAREAPIIVAFSAVPVAFREPEGSSEPSLLLCKEEQALGSTIEPVEVFWKCNKGYLNVPRSLPNGDILIANVGDPSGNAKGGFVLLDGQSFELKGNWENECSSPPSGYEFWYQPRHNVLISTAGFALKHAGWGFNPDDLKKGVYGRRLNVWNLSCRTLTQCFDLGEDSLPLSVKFLHNPDAAEGYVSCALSGVIYRFYKCEASARVVAACSGSLPQAALLCVSSRSTHAFTVDLVISLDDKYLYLSNWLHGDIRQYELSRNCKPRLVGQVFVGGSILRGGPVAVCRDEELKCQPEPLVVKCKRVYGGPSRLQLSLDGKRLYVTNSFYSTWDKQFYPNLIKEGSVMLQIDVDTEKGGLCVNKNFLVDFGNEPNGPCLAKDIHFPSGDSTSETVA
ncbi:methanethiol oxidase-like [Amazona ochrocephala]